MADVTPISLHIDSSDLMTTGEVARFLRRSIPTVRALTLRSWHPLPYANTGSGKKVQRVFHRPAVIRWVEEEIAMTSGAPPASAPTGGRLTRVS